MSRLAIDDCFVAHEQRLTHQEAVAALKSAARVIAGSEQVALASADGRIVSEPIVAGFPVPAHTNAAVDGFAFAHSSYDRTIGKVFPVAGRAAAGHALETSIDHGSAARIFTGAVMPDGTDTVAMQEDCRLADGAVTVPGGLKAGANVRKAGEDVAAGSTLFTAGHRLRPQDLAALASIGVASLACHRRLRVGIVASGDEVRTPGEVLGRGHVFDANSPMLQALVALTGAEAVSLGIWRDDAAHVQAQLAEAAERFDVLLTTGGASKGEEDHMAAALAALGSRHFWQIAVKPGRPMMFGQIARREPGRPACLVAGLPGNPVAVFVCFLMYVFPLLQRLGGAVWREPRRFHLPATFEFRGRKPGRREFWRGMLVDRPEGLAVDKFARDGSGLISGLRAADGLIDIPEAAGDVAPGDLVAFIPFSEFGIVGG